MMKNKSLNLFLFIFAFCLVSILSCDDESKVDQQIVDDTTPPSFTKNPTIELDPNGNTPLAAELKIETDEPVFVTVNIFEENESEEVANQIKFSEINFDELDTNHSLPVLGFHTDSKYDLEIVVEDQSGNQTIYSELLNIVTDPLPSSFPPVDCEIINNDLLEPGITIFGYIGRGANSGGGIIALDNNCNIIWYYRENGILLTDLRRISSGNLLFLRLPSEKMREIDMLGNIVNEWGTSNNNFDPKETIIVDAESFHHEVFEMNNGNFLVLDLELIIFDDYPTSTSDPFAPTNQANVVGDVVIEFNKEGEIINKWSMLDLLDPYRINYNSLVEIWNSQFPDNTPTRDWSHGNGVIHDTSDNSIIVSFRHQDAVVKFSRDTGELIWILGPPENWNTDVFGKYLLTPIGNNFEWPYHQHAPMITPSGNILIYDNGNFRASPFDEQLSAVENYSRAVEYRVDEHNMQVEQVWEYGKNIDMPVYTPFIGDADILPQTGNVLITFGGIAKDQDGNNTDAINGQKISAKIVEVTHQNNPQKVLEINIEDTTLVVSNGWQVYRSEKLQSLYP